MSGVRRERVGVLRRPTESIDLRIATIALAAIGADLLAKISASTVTLNGNGGRIVHSVNPGLALGIAHPPFAVRWRWARR